MHAVDPKRVRKDAMWLSQGDIFDMLEGYAMDYPNSTRWITLSGGNPAIHDLTHLVTKLRIHGWRIALETQGSTWHDWIRECDVVTISPKAPNMSHQFDPNVLNTFLLNMGVGIKRVNFKFVIFDKGDIEFSAQVANIFKLPPESIFLSQGNSYVNEAWDMSKLTDRLRSDYLNLLDVLSKYPGLSQVKFLPQFHVWLWGNKQGV
jgi:7-carboxy-7-deazaguanine synthase